MAGRFVWESMSEDKQVGGAERKLILERSVDKLGRICLDVLKDKWSPCPPVCTVYYPGPTLCPILTIHSTMTLVAKVWKEEEGKALVFTNQE